MTICIYIGIGSFQRFFSTYHHPYTIGLTWWNRWNHPILVLVQQVTSMAGGTTGTVPALIAEAKGRGHSTCEGWVKNHGKHKTKKHWNCFFWSTWSTFIDFPGVFWALKWLEVIRNDVFCFLYSNLKLFDLGCCFHSWISCLNLALKYVGCLSFHVISGEQKVHHPNISRQTQLIPALLNMDFPVSYVSMCCLLSAGRLLRRCLS